MPLSDILFTNAAVISGLICCVWLMSLPLRDVSIVDIAWGLGFVLVAWVSFSQSDASSPRTILLLACTTIWGLRLSSYLAWRNIGKPEDYRYQDMRKRFGPRFPFISLLIVFGLQGVVMWIVSLPLQTGFNSEEATAFGWTNIAGAIIWLVGILFEAIGDYQLARFKADPSNTNKTMDRGLWRYTRHPNYFGDFLVWWGLYAMSLADGRFWWSVVGPIVMSVFLMKISGVTLLERSLATRKDGYQDYIDRTSAFFPMQPKSR